MYKVLFSIITSVLVAGCAHHRDVRPGADGIHRVIIQTDGDAKQNREAIDQANHFCEEQKKYAAFIEEKQTYTGKVDEKTYNNGKVASKVLKTVGGGAYVFGAQKESQIGGVGVLAGEATDSALGQGYTVEMTFKCQ